MEVLDNQIELFVHSPRKTAICPKCQKSSRRVHKCISRSIKHMLHDDKLVLLKLSIRDFRCSTCGLFREQIPGIDRRQTTQHFRESMVPKVKDRSFSSVGKEYNISSFTVSRATNQLIERVAISWPDNPFALGLDGHSFSGHDMVTTVTDISNHNLLTILPDDKQITVRTFLRKTPINIRRNIICVCIDMDQALRGAIEKEMPGTPIVIDKFHVIQFLNQHLDAVRRLWSTKKHPLPKKLIEKNKEELSPPEKKRLEKIFKLYPTIAEIWRLKEIIRRMYRAKNKKQAEQIYLSVLDGLRGDGRARWDELFRTLKRWRDYILNYFIFNVTNAYTEGVHTRIKLLKRISYGFRNKANYIAKMSIAFIPPAVLLEAIQHHLV